MTIYVLSGNLTSAPGSAAPFLEAACLELEMGVVCPINNDTAAYRADVRYGDGVIFANPELDRDISGAAQDLLERAVAVGAVVLPVAMSAESRKPPAVVAVNQSHDVIDAARRRDLRPNAITPLAQEFARIALARVSPTLGVDQIRLFLCHRRTDGEDLVAAVDKELSKRHSKFFRDLVDVQSGELAQEKIDDALSTADVLIFFDTPDAGESAWVALELATALGRGIPVLWIRVGSEGPNRAPLPVQPGGSPLLTPGDVPDDLTDRAAFGRLADRILLEADVLNRVSLRTACETFAEISAHCRRQGRTLDTLDARHQIYAITEPAQPGAYPRRQSIHVVQVFARHPTTEDQQRLTEWLVENGYGPHEAKCRAFDAAVLLDPLPGMPQSFSEFGIREPAGDYLGRLRQVAPARDQYHDGTLLLLGAFPSAVGSHQAVIEAVRAVSSTWLELGGSIVCGGHPTFVPLLTEAVRNVGATREQLLVYWSRYYATSEAIDALLTQATVVPIDAIDGDRAASLTAMRTVMMSHSDRAAVVAIGGRTSEMGRHTPGLDEEVRLARERRLPVYLIGGPGGQTAHLAHDAAGSGWTTLGNPLASNENTFLAESDHYDAMARLIWSGHR